GGRPILLSLERDGTRSLLIDPDPPIGPQLRVKIEHRGAISLPPGYRREAARVGILEDQDACIGDVDAGSVYGLGHSLRSFSSPSGGLEESRQYIFWRGCRGCLGNNFYIYPLAKTAWCHGLLLSSRACMRSVM